MWNTHEVDKLPNYKEPREDCFNPLLQKDAAYEIVYKYKFG